MPLTPRQARFVQEYLVDLNATQAAIRAGYSARTAHIQGSQLLSKTYIADAISKAQSKRGAKLEISAETVLQQWWEMANVDVREIVEYRRGPCKSCWEGCNEKHKHINPECPACEGDGHGRVYIHDTRTLSPAAAKLYAGVQVGKDGIKALIEARDKARENVARHLGMFVDRQQQLDRNGKPTDPPPPVLSITIESPAQVIPAPKDETSDE